MRTHKKAFTLIEVMIVVSIIGLLAAIGIPSFRKARDNSTKKRMENNARLVASGIAQVAIAEGWTDDHIVQKTDIESYIKNGWNGLSIKQIEATFPADTRVSYWENDISVIASDLYATY